MVSMTLATLLMISSLVMAEREFVPVTGGGMAPSVWGSLWAVNGQAYVRLNRGQAPLPAPAAGRHRAAPVCLAH
ncbi:hypothetical protein D3C78_1647580 [compost metagenome]